MAKDKQKKGDEVVDEQAADVTVDRDKTLRNHVIGSMGVGLIPLPLVDFVALTGVQLNMLRKLANSYDIDFSEGTVKNILGSLIGSSLPISLSSAVASVVKTIPIVGQMTGALTMPILSGATTYAVGKVFIQHFASGGTFLDFDPDSVRDYYEEMFTEGKDLATKLQKEDAAKKSQ